MTLDSSASWNHDHAFGQDQKKPGEVRTILVIGITAIMMVVEIAAGIIFGSMALLADGLHMASHTAALSIAAFAYIYARRRAHDRRFSFGTGKVNALGGFTGALLLSIFALVMVWESVSRMISPVEIAFNHAILVAVIGLIVNGASMLILGHEHTHDHGDQQPHDHSHDHLEQGQHHHDQNLQAAYLHVLADTLTSVLAIFALLAGKYFGLIWMDPLMGIVGALLVGKWSLGLLQTTSSILLDHQGPTYIEEAIRQSIENGDENRIVDLHLWSIGPNIYAVELTVIAIDPQPTEHYKSLIPSDLGIAHIMAEVYQDEERLS